MTESLKKHQLGPVEFDQEDFQKATGARSEDLQTRLIHQALEALCLTPRMPRDELGRQIKAAVAALAEIKPQDGLEGMLAVQMVATHDAAMECLRRAAIDGQTDEAREACLRQATSLMNVSLRQLEALNKHRGKGNQTVMVKYVNVESGGQAVVGAVNTGLLLGQELGDGVKPASVIEHQAVEPLIIDQSPAPVPSKRKRTSR